MKRALMLAALPCLLLLASATQDPQRDVSLFSYEIEHCLQGEEVYVDWHFKVLERKEFRFFLYVTDSSFQQAAYSIAREYNLSSYEPGAFFNRREEIPSAYTDSKTIYFMFGIQSVSPRDNWSQIVYRDAELGRPIYKYDISESIVIPTGRYRYYSDWQGSYRSEEFYRFSYVPSGADSNSIGIEDWSISHEDTDGNLLPMEAEFEFRLLNHLECLGIATSAGGYAYVKLILSEIPQNPCKYRFKTKVRYVVDRVTGKMSYYATTDNQETYFYSDAIFMNTTSRKPEDNVFHYQIVGLGVSGTDNLAIDMEKDLGNSHYGNCHNADYCVVIGES